MNPALKKDGWNPAIRVAAGAAGVAMAIYGFSRPHAVGIAAAVLGTGLVTRAATNTDVLRIIGLKRKSRYPQTGVTADASEGTA